MSSKWYLGVDLGQKNDYTAFALIEEIKTVVSEREEWSGSQRRHRGAKVTSIRHEVRHLERMRGESYRVVGQRVARLMADTLAAAPIVQKRPPYGPWEPAYKRPPTLVVDATGVGQGVVDELEANGLDPTAIWIHGGDRVSKDSNGYRVPKRDLVAVVQVGLQNGTFQIAEGLALAPALVAELHTFKVTIDPKTAHDSYSAWREADHDDLVLAVALALWLAKNPPGGWWIADYSGNILQSSEDYD